MKLSILLPVYNEEANLERLLQRLLAIDIAKEVVAVDDCSRDQSREILNRFAGQGVTVVCHAVNQGKGAAVRTALAHATGDYVIIQDADNELDPNDILRLLEPVRQGKTKVVYGTRDLRVQSRSNFLGNKMLTLATNLLFGTRVSDMETCYKLMPTRVMRSLELRSNGFDIEPEITAKLARAGHSIYEVPISYQPRREHKKMRPLRDGFAALRALLKYRFEN
jgi:glycosyltransferase involved in cell wall biosynthesis